MSVPRCRERSIDWRRRRRRRRCQFTDSTLSCPAWYDCRCFSLSWICDVRSGSLSAQGRRHVKSTFHISFCRWPQSGGWEVKSSLSADDLSSLWHKDVLTSTDYIRIVESHTTAHDINALWDWVDSLSYTLVLLMWQVSLSCAPWRLSCLSVCLTVCLCVVHFILLLALPSWRNKRICPRNFLVYIEKVHERVWCRMYRLARVHAH